MNEEELAALVVKLTGDGSGYQKMLDEALQQTKSFASTVVQTLASVAELAGFKSSLSAFTDYQDSLVRIETAVKANGLAVESTMRDYKEFAEQIEATTRVSSIQATSLLAMAHSFDLVGEKAQKAVRLGIGISQGRPGTSPQEVIRALSMFWRTSEMRGAGAGGGASNMGIMYLARILGLYARGMGGRGMGGGGAESSEKMIEEINKQLKIAEEVSNQLGQNFGGQLARIKSYLQDIAVDLGGIVAKWLKPFVDQLQKVVKWFKELNPAFKQVLTAFMALAVILTTSGPIMRFFLLLLRLGTHISPITLALSGAAVATAAWVNQIGGLAEAWSIAYGRFAEFVSMGLQWLGSFISSHKELTVIVAGTAVAIGGVLLAMKGLAATVALLNAMVDALFIKQIIARAATVAWTVAMIAASIAMQAFSVLAFLWKAASVIITVSLVVLKGLLVTLTGLLGFSSLGWHTYTIGATIAKIATWLFNAALTVTHALISFGVTLLVAAAVAAAAFGASLGIAATSLAALTTLVMSLVSPLVALWTYLENIEVSLAGIVIAIPPLRIAIPIFKEWWDIIRSIVKAMSVDMDLAWKIAVAGATLAYYQVKALWPSLWDYIASYAKQVWPPIWDFIKAGSAALGKFILGQLVKAFYNAAVQSAKIVGGMFGAIALAVKNPFQALDTLDDFAKKAGQTIGEIIGEGSAEGLQTALGDAVNDLNTKLKGVKVDFGEVVDTPEIIEARKRVQELQAQLAKLTNEQKKDQKGIDLGSPFKAAEHEIKKWEATLFGSAEAYSRVTEYMDKINESSGEKGTFALGGGGEAGGAKTPEVATPPVGGDGSGETGETGLKALTEMTRRYMGKGWPVTITNTSTAKVK